MHVLSIDTETELIAPGVKAPRLVVISTSLDGVAAELIPWYAATPFMLEAFRAAAEKRIKIVGHNIALYDLPVLLAHNPALVRAMFAALDAGGIVDTLILAKQYYRATGDLSTAHFGLDWLAQKWLDAPPLDKGADGWRLRYGELRDVLIAQWPERAIAYSKEDATVAWRLCETLVKAGRTLYSDLYAPHAVEVRAAFALGLMSTWGFITDPERVAALESTYAAKLETARAAMAAAGLIRDTNRAADGARRLFRGGGEKPEHWVKDTKAIKARLAAAASAQGFDLGRTDKDDVSTSARWLKQSRDPVLSACVDYARAQKILSTYAPLMRSGLEHPIQCSFDPMLETGRTSTFNPSIQNISKAPGVRECVVPRPGHYLCSVDYNAAELRSWGQVTTTLGLSSEMARTFRRDPNADPHLEFAAARLLPSPVSFAEAKRLKKAGDKAIKNARQRAKAANFGFPGGMGAARFSDNEEKKYWESDGADGILISIDDAYRLRRAWYDQWTEAKPYFAWAASQAETSGVFRGVSSGAYRGGCGFCDGANNGFQELTAWAAKHALYAVAKACYLPSGSPLYGSRIILFAHDEIITELPIDGAHDAALEQTRLMVEASQAVHLDVPITAEPALMECWTKAAEYATDEHGRLIPWRPKAKEKAA